MRRSHLVLAVLAALLLTTTPFIAAQGAEPGRDSWHVLDNDAKQSLELQILSDFVPYAESFWRASDIDVPDTGRYDAVGSGVTQPRGAGDIAFAYATLLTAEPEQASFGGVSRATMLDHTIQSIRHEAYTNALSGAGYNTWGGNTWQASLETYGWADAAHLLWSELDADTRAVVKKVVTGEADILITKPVATATPGNTGAEDNAWNTPTPALAAVMFPDHPNATAWDQAAIKLALNASSTTADADDDTVIDGKPLSEWMASVNLNDDLTIENHGFFNPIYQQDVGLLVGDGAIFYAQAGHPQPDAFSFRVEKIWDAILGRLVDDNGDIVMPAGQDWISKDYQHLDYLSVLATRFQDDAASVLESRALETVAQRQATHPDGSLLAQPQLGYESMLIKRLTGSWWNHELFDPSPTPTEAEFDAARAETAGVLSLPSVNVIGDRTRGATSYMSWDTESPMGLWIPSSSKHPDDRVFTYYQKGSLIGSASGAVSAYKCRCGSDQFSTAGVIGQRNFSMTTFADGTTMLLNRGTGDTFTYSLEDIPGVTGDRTVYSAGGSGLGALDGDWVDVADRMAMVVKGGGGISAKDLTGTNNTRLITGSTGTGSGNRGALLLPDVAHADAAGLAAQVDQPTVPDGWSALTARAPDGTTRLAIARWSGPEAAPLDLPDQRGAPVPVEPATIDRTSTRVPVALDAPDSRGETIRYFVRTDGPLAAHQDGEHRAVLTNVGKSAVHTTTTYVAGDGSTQTARRVIAPGETVTARTVAGELTLAGAEYEHLLRARGALTGLSSSLQEWVDQHRISQGEHDRLSAATDSALAAIRNAARQAEATAPDVREIANQVRFATSTISRLQASAQDPADVRDAIRAAATESADALGRADAELTVHAEVTVVGDPLPGEPVTVRVLAFNRSGNTATAGRVRIDPLPGWRVPSDGAIFDSLTPGASAEVELPATLDPTATPGDVDVSARVTYEAVGRSGTATAHHAVTVLPTYTLTTPDPTLPLASGGWNAMRLTLHNNSREPLAVDLAATAPSGVAATVGDATVTVPAGGDAATTVDLMQTGQTSGSGEVEVRAHAANGVTATTTSTLTYSDNLALNPSGARFPAASANSSQGQFPPGLATNGNVGDFWVSGTGSPGAGPTPDHPETLGVDLGAPVTVGSVTMQPRANYGPRTYRIQVSDDANSWTTVASVTDGPNSVQKTTFSPVTARYVRILITAGYDRTNRNVQVIELEVRPS